MLFLSVLLSSRVATQLAVSAYLLWREDRAHPLVGLEV
jgi:hypothetical protein